MYKSSFQSIYIAVNVVEFQVKFLMVVFERHSCVTRFLRSNLRILVGFAPPFNQAPPLCYLSRQRDICTVSEASSTKFFWRSSSKAKAIEVLRCIF